MFQSVIFSSGVHRIWERDRMISLNLVGLSFLALATHIIFLQLDNALLIAVIPTLNETM